ncbi:hypothetical protein NDU88_004292 [Pleurodeles waltl]|uniref:Uncharacterized protein n=1 Tax=Pleurodeles waltl TaxID=8319 RepID=A0AAV7UIU4_PLEWA|nr:hypothetical protein NDU88_004292 [Pleurodeles waltl]
MMLNYFYILFPDANPTQQPPLRQEVTDATPAPQITPRPQNERLILPPISILDTFQDNDDQQLEESVVQTNPNDHDDWDDDITIMPASPIPPSANSLPVDMAMLALRL